MDSMNLAYYSGVSEEVPSPESERDDGLGGRRRRKGSLFPGGGEDNE
jgi:hypothetical protein